MCAGILALVLKGSGDSKSLSSGFGKKIGLVKVEGAIYQSNSIVEQLRSFRQDKNISGVLLRVDSPGGGVAPSQEIYNEVMRYKSENKPLVVSMGNTAASGGYYISSPAQKIFAAPGTITGSIGVIMSLPMYKELGDKLGIQVRTLKAGELKDMGSPYRGITSKENHHFDLLLKDIHNQFIDDVARGRGMPRDSVAVLANGSVYTGNMALANNLIDTLGGYEDALDYLRKISGAGSQAKVVERKKPSSALGEWLIEEIINIFPQTYTFLSSTGFHYLFSL
ncbi:MAG: signal peptide peptidase SppA [Fibrobacter sp.]|nr:signal peptide peptidase SppA [Fibrobacter sp.]